MRPFAENVLAWMLAHERHMSAVGLFAGLLFDAFTANRTNALFPNILITTYFCIAGACIILMNVRGAEGKLGPIPLLTILQFSFGNLTSALFVLYGRSGTLVGSGAFIALFALMLVGNEFARSQYARTRVQIVIWFSLFLPYAALIVPVVLGRFGIEIFLLSGAVALTAVSGLITLVGKVAARPVRESLSVATGTVVVVYAAFTGAYFANLIPPVPLMLTHIGVYHSVERTNGEYHLAFEPPPRWMFWRDTAPTFSYVLWEPAYCFASVFAPDRLTTPIFHRWEKKAADGAWETRLHLSFPISGGRENGYRGYTQTYRIEPGEWRCSVETERGALVGRTSFTVVEQLPAALESAVF